MGNINFYPHQIKELEETKNLNKVAYYLDMGLGKTFVGAEKAMQLGYPKILVICQKSKIDDWVEHFKSNYLSEEFPKRNIILDLTNKDNLDKFMCYIDGFDYIIGIINYELAFRRKELLQLKDFTLMLDESSLIQNEQAKRSKFIMKLQAKNIILLSGTPTSGKYEKLWSQLHLLGWNISKDLFWKQYVDTEIIDNQGFPIKVVRGYKNVERLKSKMREYGCRFLKTDEVFDLPEQVFNEIKIDPTPEYVVFKKDRIVTFETKHQLTNVNKYDNTCELDIEVKEFVGDTTLTKMLYERMLCGSYNSAKLEALKDLISSTEDRMIIFYNFNEELRAIEDMCIELDRPTSFINGQTKDLSCWNECGNAILLGQYQAASMGLNLQQGNKIIYFTPPLSSELFEQSKKRTNRIGQDRTCFYYQLICRNSIEEKIYRVLKERKDYTDKLFEQEED